MAILGVADVQHHARAVDVRGGQREHLGDAKPRAVEEHEHGAVLERGRRVEQRADLLPAGDVGLAILRADSAHADHDLGALEGDVVEHTQGGDVNVDRARAAALLLEQVEQPRADVLLAELGGRAPIEGHEGARVSHVGARRAGRAASQREVFDHAVLKLSHRAPRSRTDPRATA